MRYGDCRGVRGFLSRTTRAFSAACLALSANCWAASTALQAESKMSDADSRTKAREPLLEKLRLQAAQEAGKLVEMTPTMRDGSVTEEVKLVTVSMTAIDVISERVEENQRLRDALSALSAANDMNVGGDVYAARLRQHLSDLRHRAGAVFEGGVLDEFAALASADWQRSRALIDRIFIAPVSAMRVRVALLGVVEDEVGYTARVGVHWSYGQQ